MSSSSVIKNTDSEKRNDSLRYHILAVVLLSAVVWFLLDTATNDEPLEISSLLQMSEQGYDYFMADVDSIHYTSDGTVDYRFQANRITHFPNPEFSLVESPRFLVFGEDDSNWEINSTKGRVEIDQETNQERLLLNEDVIIHGLSKDGRHINIFTHSLVIYPAEKNLRSDSDVTIESDGFVSSSKGFTADLNTNIVRQLLEGRMQYDN
jgi:LPS export ABC transporter protein LptC